MICPQLEIKKNKENNIYIPLNINRINKEIKIRNCMPLNDIPAGTDIHNIELTPNGGGKLARSAGSMAQISGIFENYCIFFSNP